jgi:HAD superfamily hydrolase (TIGR01662 family)
MPENMPEKSQPLSESHIVKPALCLDFDGTIRRSKNGNKFIKNTKDVELIPGVEEKIWKYRDKDYLILGISNQAGVAHGFKLPMEIEGEMEATLELFGNNPFHIIKMCYHDQNGHIFPYNYRSLLRKPNYGMLAIMEYEAFNNGYVIDWDNSLFVGNRDEDQMCAESVGIGFQHISNFLQINGQ